MTTAQLRSNQASPYVLHTGDVVEFTLYPYGLLTDVEKVKYVVTLQESCDLRAWCKLTNVVALYKQVRDKSLLPKSPPLQENNAFYVEIDINRLDNINRFRIEAELQGHIYYDYTESGFNACIFVPLQAYSAFVLYCRAIRAGLRILKVDAEKDPWMDDAVPAYMAKVQDSLTNLRLDFNVYCSRYAQYVCNTQLACADKRDTAVARYKNLVATKKLDAAQWAELSAELRIGDAGLNCAEDDTTYIVGKCDSTNIGVYTLVLVTRDNPYSATFLQLPKPVTGLKNRFGITKTRTKEAVQHVYDAAQTLPTLTFADIANMYFLTES